MRDWLDTGNGRLAVGGKLRRELGASSNFQKWLRIALLKGRAIDIEDAKVDADARILEKGGCCISNDAHVLALARCSNARLLFTNDRKLQEDFRNSKILPRPEGHIYTTLMHRKITKAHRKLLRRSDLCGKSK